MADRKLAGKKAALTRQRRMVAAKAVQTRKRRAAERKAAETRRANAVPNNLRDMIALSVRQPYAEQILRGGKQIEYRSRVTNIRRRVLLYASLQPGDLAEFKRLNVEPGDLHTGVLVGSVEI